MTPLTAITTTTSDDIRQLRDALRGTLGTKQDGALPTVDLEWRAGWTALADLGVTAFCVPEERGGFGLHVDAAVAAAIEFGAALHGSPFAGITACLHSLGQLDSGDESSELFAALLAGQSIGGFGRLGADGVARVVDGGGDVDALLLVEVSTKSMLLVTDRTAWTALPQRHPFDVSRTSADLAIDTTAVRPIVLVPSAVDLYGLLLAADALGGVQRMLERTVAYAAERIAFGRPIGGFQAVQHRLVDHTVRVRGMALMVDEAARQLAAGGADAHRRVLLAEIAVSSGAAHILHDLLQLTGAIGFTWEHGLHFYERRAHQDARLAGNPRAAVRALTELEAWS